MSIETTVLFDEPVRFNCKIESMQYVSTDKGKKLFIKGIENGKIIGFYAPIGLEYQLYNIKAEVGKTYDINYLGANNFFVEEVIK